MNKKYILYILATAFCFSTMEVAVKLSGATFNSLQLTFLRFFIGGLVLLPFSIIDIKKRGIQLTMGDMGYLLFLGAVNVSLSMVLLQVGVMGINANLSAIIISTNPVFTMIFAHFVANEPFTRRKALVLSLMLTGLVIAANPASIFTGENKPLYLCCSVLSAATFGFYTAYGKRRIAKLGGMTQNAFSFLLGSCVLLVIILLTDTPLLEGVNLETMPILLYLGVVVTGLGYYFYLKSIALCGPSMASIAFFLKPIFAPILAFIVLSEPITANLMIGVVFILTGSYINISSGFKKA